MARKITSKIAPAKKSVAAAAAPIVTAVRNSPVPRPLSPLTAARTLSREAVAKRAFEIYSSGKGGSAEENWLRAERELRGF